ncbi:MAG TPA: hypothetical protein PK340_04535 [Bacilli bacterium]|nr:hypothetical protein [Bacilli bacterium]
MKKVLLICLTPLLLVIGCNSSEITSTSSSSEISGGPISYGDGRRHEYETLDDLMTDFPVDFSVDDYQYAIPIFDEPNQDHPGLPYYVADCYAYYDTSEQKQYTKPEFRGSGFINSLFGTRQLGFYTKDSIGFDVDFSSDFYIEVKISDNWIDIYYYSYSVFIIKIETMDDNSGISVSMLNEFIHNHVIMISSSVN